MKKSSIAAAMIAGIALQAHASEVDQSDVTTFQAGAPALASEMNTTIQALITAIDDNAARIAAMENPVTLNDLVGRSYCAVEMLNQLSHDEQGSGDRARITIGAISSILTIDSTSQLTFMSQADDIAEIMLADKIVDFDPDPDPAAYDPHNATDTDMIFFSFPSETEVLEIASFLNGTLTTTDGLVFQVSRDGNLLTNIGVESTQDQSFSGYENFMLIAVRCD